MFAIYKKWCGLMLCCWLVNACGEGNSYSLPRTVKKGEPNSVLVSVDSVNYQHDLDVRYTLYDVRTQQAVGGTIVGIFEGPGGKNCCISLPRQWRPGMKVRVEWEEGDADRALQGKIVRELEIPTYKTPGDLYVLFHPKQEVELVVSTIEPGRPGWPGKEKQPAFAACVARLSEKECRKYLPKYRYGSDEENAAFFRRACRTSMIAEAHNPQKEKNSCENWVKECRASWGIDKRMCELDYIEE